MTRTSGFGQTNQPTITPPITTYSDGQQLQQPGSSTTPKTGDKTPKYDPTVLDLLGLKLDESGIPVFKETININSAQASSAQTAGSTQKAGDTQRVDKPSDVQKAMGDVSGLDEVAPPALNLDVDLSEGAESFVAQLAEALDEVMIESYDADGKPIYKDLMSMSSEDLLAAFMKLNLLNADNTPEVLNNLAKLAKDRALAAIEKEKAKFKEQEAKLAEAANKAKDHGSSKIVNVISAVVQTVVAVVAAFIRGGPYAAIAAAVVIVGTFLVTLLITGDLNAALKLMSVAAAIVIAVCLCCPAGAAGGTGGVAVSSGSVVASSTTSGALTATTTTTTLAGGTITTTTSTSFTGLGQLVIGSSTAIVSAAPYVTEAYENMAYAEAVAAAESAGAEAKKFAMQVDAAMSDRKELQELMKLLTENRGEMINAVLKMLGNIQASNMKLQTISQTR
ncbi:MAG: hypothetical protein JW841_04575 [Deltaproteobacteria bacterium]|nr:hypothetical protein [Deltaproteobacteria bacterium]